MVFIFHRPNAAPICGIIIGGGGSLELGPFDSKEESLFWWCRAGEGRRTKKWGKFIGAFVLECVVVVVVVWGWGGEGEEESDFGK